MADLLVYSQETSPRLSYVCNLIFNEILEIEAEIINELPAADSSLPVISYDKEKIENSLHIVPAGILFEKDIINRTPEVIDYGNVPALFPSAELSDLPYDIFSAVFYMVSRYEEYLPYKADPHGRFPATASIAYTYHFLDKPVVNLWICQLTEVLKDKFNTLTVTEKQSEHLPTIDVDIPYAYLERSGMLKFTGTVRDMVKRNRHGFALRSKVVQGKEPDPYDNFDVIMALLQEHNKEALWFFQVGKYGVYDKNPPPDNPRYRALIKRIAEIFPTGLHPSYRSAGKPKHLWRELENINHLLDKHVSFSRQHYIRIDLPRTYRQLIEAGIKTDYSMGYPSHLGFRAGICHPFHFFDLELNEVTQLKVVPFQFMDITFFRSPDADISKLYEIIEHIRTVGGNFVSIWHNNYINEKYNEKTYNLFKELLKW